MDCATERATTPAPDSGAGLAEACLSQSAPGPLLSILQVMPGRAYGLLAPVVLARLAIPHRRFDAWDDVDAGLAACFDDAWVAPAAKPYADALSARIMQAATAMLQQAGLAVFEPVRRIGRQAGAAGDTLTIAAPAPPGDPQATIEALRWAHDSLMLLTGAADARALAGTAEALRGRLARRVPQASNMPMFLRAAHQAGIPVDPLAGSTYRFGWGRHARWLDSTFTDATSVLGAALARDKQATAEVLRRAGLPAPRHRRVRSAAEAVAAANAFGYPVVVKPADRDGGVGVAVGLRSPEEVGAAYDRAASQSGHILVEAQFSGRDYRLAVYHGALIWSVERVPGGLTGDGIHSVAELLHAYNAEPRRCGPRAVLKPLLFDAEAQVLLAEAGYTETAVPPDGAYIRLRGAANMSAGGTPKVVNDRVHPDNRRLAEDAATALRLDIAGIDLLIDDVACSWRQSGAMICEVNSQPQLGASTQRHLHAQVLSGLLHRQGRVPILALLGRGAGQAAETLRAGLAGQTGIGIATEHAGAIDGIVVTGTMPSLFAAAEALLGRPQLGVLLLAIETPSVLATGLPVDRIDHLVLACDTLVERGSSETRGAERLSPIGAVLRLIGPHIAGLVFATPAASALRTVLDPGRIHQGQPEAWRDAAAARLQQALAADE